MTYEQMHYDDPQFTTEQAKQHSFLIKKYYDEIGRILGIPKHLMRPSKHHTATEINMMSNKVNWFLRTYVK